MIWLTIRRIWLLVGTFEGLGRYLRSVWVRFKCWTLAGRWNWVFWGITFVWSVQLFLMITQAGLVPTWATSRVDRTPCQAATQTHQFKIIQTKSVFADVQKRGMGICIFSPLNFRVFALLIWIINYFALFYCAQECLLLFISTPRIYIFDCVEFTWECLCTCMHNIGCTSTYLSLGISFPSLLLNIKPQLVSAVEETTLSE